VQQSRSNPASAQLTSLPVPRLSFSIQLERLIYYLPPLNVDGFNSSDIKISASYNVVQSCDDLKSPALQSPSDLHP
jgi:hypothetical protein